MMILNKRYPIQMIFVNDDFQMKIKRLNGFDYEIYTVKIHYL